MDHVRTTGRPETFCGLFVSKISKDEPFTKLAQFEIQQSKRRDGTMADCPMCRPNKYLHGQLVYFPNLQITAAIGHCCANKENQRLADKEFKRQEQAQREEYYLLENLKRVPDCLALIEKVKPCAKEAQRLYRELRRSDTGVWRILADLKKQNGRLFVTEEIQGVTALAGGPAGFRGHGRNAVETRDIQLGVLTGMTIFTSQYSPVADLEHIRRKLTGLDHGRDDDTALAFVVDLTDEQRHEAYENLRKAAMDFGSLRKKLADVATFFSSGNLDRLARWAAHSANKCCLSVSKIQDMKGIVTGCAFQNKASIGRTTSCRLTIDPALWDHNYSWPIDQ